MSDIKELKNEELKNASGGNLESNSSSYFDECFNAILRGNGVDAWYIYHDHFNEISSEDRKFLAEQYYDEFQCDINDDCLPM